MLKILKSLSPEFFFLIEEENFKIVEFKSTPENFGNFLFILNHIDFQVRIYSDRAQRFIDISYDGENWHKLEYVLEFMDPAFSSKHLDRPPKFEDLAKFMKKNIVTLFNIFKSQSNIVSYKKFEYDKERELIKKIFGN